MRREYFRWWSPALQRDMDLLVVGHNRYFSDLLWQKNIWHALRVWDGWAHDWPWWQQMLPMYIGGAD